MKKDELEHFKAKLLAEKAALEEDLSGIARPDSGKPGGWEATSGEMEVDAADDNEVADKLEELEENTGITDQLDNQLGDVKAALEKIEKGTYGLCETCGKPIEKERLEANPAARISIKHSH